MTKQRKLFFLFATLFACILFVSCAGKEPIEGCLSGHQYGFLYGLIHGFITPISFITGLFRDNVTIYAVNNTGSWYDFGFLLGSSGWGFMAGNRSKGKR